ncbi:hypothetical protein O988_05679 [Pseudogymnoascus sp. VKM F-3808]|nr:hypothetical protein O988_05679 [Pseudogymnoascus sp. VKM F-3808]
MQRSERQQAQLALPLFPMFSRLPAAARLSSALDCTTRSKPTTTPPEKANDEFIYPYIFRKSRIRPARTCY